MDFEPVNRNRNYTYFELIRRWEYLLLRDRQYVMELIDSFCMVKEGIGLEIVIGEYSLRKNLIDSVGITGESIYHIEFLWLAKKTAVRERAKELELLIESIRKLGYESKTPTYCMEFHPAWWVQRSNEFLPRQSASEQQLVQAANVEITEVSAKQRESAVRLIKVVEEILLGRKYEPVITGQCAKRLHDVLIECFCNLESIPKYPTFRKDVENAIARAGKGSVEALPSASVFRALIKHIRTLP